MCSSDLLKVVLWSSVERHSIGPDLPGVSHSPDGRFTVPRRGEDPAVLRFSRRALSPALFSHLTPSESGTTVVGGSAAGPAA